MWLYFIVFSGALAVDVIPLVGPPAWTLMVFMQMKFQLNIWGVLIAGVLGSTLGRYLLAIAMPKLSKHLVNRHKREEMEFMGKKLGKKTWQCWLFVLLYTLTPLSSTALFTAAGMAKVQPLKLLVPFFIGKFASDALMVGRKRIEALFKSSAP